MTDTARHHTLDYIEFPVTDLAKSRAFYEAAFGWTFNEYGPAYLGIQGPEREMGGMYPADEVKTGGPLIILYSGDLEASLAAVEQAGAKIVKPIFSFPGGRRFHFTDPSGHELAVWTTTSA